MKKYMAINQYGDTYHGLTHPRKDLCEKLGRSHAEKIYIDGKDGKSYHVGYLIAGEWLEVYEVKPLRKEVK